MHVIPPVAPGRPTNVKISAVSSTALMVSWDKPTENNGVILDYTVRYFCVNTNRCQDDRQHTARVHSYLVTGLYPYTEYGFVVSARTVAGGGPETEVKTSTTLEAGEKSLKC